MTCFLITVHKIQVSNPSLHYHRCNRLTCEPAFSWVDIAVEIPSSPAIRTQTRRNLRISRQKLLPPRQPNALQRIPYQQRSSAES